MHIFILVSMNFIVIVSSFLVNRKLFKINNLIDFLISWFIFYLDQIVLVELLLGILGMLYLRYVVLLHLAILLIIYLITKDDPFYFGLGGVKGTVCGLLRNKTILLCTSVILGFALVKIAINLVNPPFGWDDLNYHFTFPVEWLKCGNLNNPPVVSCDPSPTYYPINGSLFFFWFIIPLKNVFIADLGQVPFFIIAFLAVYSLGRKLNLSKEYSLFSAFLFSLIPNYFKQLEIAYIDVMVAALFLVAVHYFFLLSKELCLKNTIMFSLTLGLMVGTKTTALAFAPLLLIPFFYFYFRELNMQKMMVAFLFSLFFIVAMGGFSYIRNFLQTGNPLYPLNLTLFNKVIFRGVIDNSTYRAHFLPHDYNLGKILFSEGLGGQAVIFLLPAIFLGLPITILRNRKGLDFNLIYFMLLPVLLILVYRFVIPLANLRYLYALMGISSVIAFYAADRLRLPEKILKILIILCVLGAVAELAKHMELAISVIVSAILFFLLPVIFKSINRKQFAIFSVLILISGFILLSFLEKDYARHEYRRYVKMVKYSGFWPDAAKAWEWLNQSTEADNIAYVGRPVPFPLYGSYFKNNVYYVSVNKCEPAMIHYFSDSKYVWGYDGESVHKSFSQDGNYRGKPDSDIWLDNLLKKDTDYLFVYSLHQIKGIEFPIEDKWASQHPAFFNLVFENDIVHIYKVIK